MGHGSGFALNALVPELAVRDFTVSRRFYCEVLGFSVVYERPEDGFGFLQLGDAQLMLDQIGTGRTFGDLAATTPFG